MSIRKITTDSASQKSASPKRPRRTGLLFHVGAGALLVVVMVCVALYLFAH